MLIISNIRATTDETASRYLILQYVGPAAASLSHFIFQFVIWAQTGPQAGPQTGDQGRTQGGSQGGGQGGGEASVRGAEGSDG